jgi:hypothetical protein
MQSGTETARRSGPRSDGVSPRAYEMFSEPRYFGQRAPIWDCLVAASGARSDPKGTRTWLRHRLFCSPNRTGGGSFGSGDENRSVTAVPASPATTAVSSAAGPDTPCLATGIERVVAPIAVPVRTPDGVLMSPGVPGISCGRCPLCRSVSSANLVTPRQARCVATAPQQSPSLGFIPRRHPQSGPPIVARPQQGV